MKDIQVKDVMTQNLITVKSYQTVSEVSRIFNEHSFHHIPIIHDDDSLAGIISLTDFERIKNGTSLFRNPKIEKYNEALFSTLLARDIMTKDVVELCPTDTIHQAYQIFKKNRFRALPIISKGKLTGIITPFDMIEYFFEKEYSLK